MAKIVIEEINLLGHVTKLHTFDNFPISIGRGYHNDLILSDVYISPSHLELHQTADGWEAIDLDSDNGTEIKRNSNDGAANQLHSGDHIIVGRTKLRLLSPSHPVNETRSLLASDDIAKIISRPLFATGIACLAALVFILDAQLQTITKTSASKLLTDTLPIFMLVLFWAGIWAFVGRVIKHKANFLLQFVLALLFTAASVVISDISDYTNYMTSSNLATEITGNLLNGLAFATLLYFNLRYSTNSSRKLNFLTSQAISWSLIAFVIAIQLTGKSDFNRNANFPAVLKPPIFNIGSNQSLQEYLDDSALMFDEAETSP